MNWVLPDVTAAGLLYAVRYSSVLALLNFFVLGSLFWSSGSVLAAEARIAVAANFRDTAEAIAARLEAESPHRYEVVTGSTGKLASQILNGAPFDVFMAADRRRPQQLVDRGLAVVGSEQIYAVGELGLWWPKLSGTPAIDALAKLEPRSVCMANPAFAPYGEAALAMLKKSGVEASWLEGVVRVDNVNLAAGLIAQGHARAGFVARSSLIAGKRQGTVAAADEEVLWFAEQAPVDQAMVLLTRAEGNVAARHWLQQMRAAPIRELIQRDGYRLPERLN